MKPNRQSKIIMHGTGVGDITDGDVEARARELAVIRGRNPDTITEEDRAEAWAELDGQLLPGTTGTDREARGALSRDPSEPISDSGHEVITAEPDEGDETQARERLATEGVEEAQHDQMLASRDREHRLDRG